MEKRFCIRTPVLNTLGIVKEKESGRKARIIWDLREFGINELCSQGERIILPRVTDAIEDIPAERRTVLLGH